MGTRVWVNGYSASFIAVVRGLAWERRGRKRKRRESRHKAASVQARIRFLVLDITGRLVFLLDGILWVVEIMGKVVVGFVGCVYGGLGG